MYRVSIVILLVVIKIISGTSDESIETVIEKPPTSLDNDSEILPVHDQALYLTKYLKNGEFKKARKLARVPLNCPDDIIIKSYSGYFTVNENYNSNLHMWYFVAQTRPKRAPVIFYFDAGPHLSTVLSAFSLTSLRIDDDFKLKCLNDQWNSKYHLVFIDNPAGTGFSFTNSTAGYANNAEMYTNDLMSAVEQFYEMFPHLKRNKMFPYGHGYGGRYAAHLGARILEDENNDFNLGGVIIANGFIDGSHQSEYGDFLYNLGLINLKEYKHLEEKMATLRSEIKNEDFACGFETYVSMLYIPNSSETLIGNLTGFNTPYNFLHKNYDDSYLQRIISYVSRPDIRCALHVRSDLKFQVENPLLLHAIRPDAMRSKLPELYSILKSNVTVLFYNGDLDIFTPYILMANTLSDMEEYGPLYEKTSRKKWRIFKNVCTDEMIEQWGSCDETLAGYITEVKKYGKLVHAYIRGGGHFVTQDQSIRTRALLDLYIN